MTETENKGKSMTQAILTSIAVPLFIFIVFGALYWFAWGGKDNAKKEKILKTIHSEVLKGNKVAIAIKCEGYSWLSSLENEDLIMAALQGNENAIKALKIDLERPNRKY